MIGYGEAAPSLRYRETAQTCVEFLSRVDAGRLSFEDVTGSMRQVESLTRGNFSPKGALNIALLDGAAKRRGQPLSEFFGLSFAEGKHVSSITIGLDSPSMTRQKVREAGSVPHIKAQGRLAA